MILYRPTPSPSNTPFDNWTMLDAPVATIVSGYIVHRRNEAAVSATAHHWRGRYNDPFGFSSTITELCKL